MVVPNGMVLDFNYRQGRGHATGLLQNGFICPFNTVENRIAQGDLKRCAFPQHACHIVDGKL